ncbi:aminoglycoside phosphotransferase family protein [Streptacidiphilus sp. ASG 303]|uniref:phosphotransferase family protein n=1 Tax=Streptacidiphilus sp. ASG 303 TaxID=2896847 RepID=UPI001E64A75F|nr:aminoglycoside phosphotransferase family protein [Streptacidiphilus sp. ASG 303]MCD0486074.1 aminoglycoside phosphotransferase family protein [Streptacidiphilus sp. ASG 303]
MSSDRWSTHAIEMGPTSVIKRFSVGDRERCEREFRALTLLAAYAPGLAAKPLLSELAAPQPTLVMSRLSGSPLRGSSLDHRQLKVLADAVTAMHNAVPPSVLAGVPLRPGHQGELITHLRTWSAVERRDDSSVVARGKVAGLAWLAQSGLENGEPDVPAAFGPGDGNLANYLWDGNKVQVVDFEDSGRSDRAFELAEITEHVSSWIGPPLDVSSFLAHVDLTAAEASRLRDCRRLLALVWLFLLSFDDPDSPRNPPGTAERQADRLMELLG